MQSIKKAPKCSYTYGCADDDSDWDDFELDETTDNLNTDSSRNIFHAFEGVEKLKSQLVCVCPSPACPVEKELDLQLVNEIKCLKLEQQELLGDTKTTESITSQSSNDSFIIDLSQHMWPKAKPVAENILLTDARTDTFFYEPQILEDTIKSGIYEDISNLTDTLDPRLKCNSHSKKLNKSSPSKSTVNFKELSSQVKKCTDSVNHVPYCKINKNKIPLGIVESLSSGGNNKLEERDGNTRAFSSAIQGKENSIVRTTNTCDSSLVGSHEVNYSSPGTGDATAREASIFSVKNSADNSMLVIHNSSANINSTACNLLTNQDTPRNDEANQCTTINTHIFHKDKIQHDGTTKTSSQDFNTNIRDGTSKTSSWEFDTNIHNGTTKTSSQDFDTNICDGTSKTSSWDFDTNIHNGTTKTSSRDFDTNIRNDTSKALRLDTNIRNDTSKASRLDFDTDISTDGSKFNRASEFKKRVHSGEPTEAIAEPFSPEHYTTIVFSVVDTKLDTTATNSDIKEKSDKNTKVQPSSGGQNVKVKTSTQNAAKMVAMDTIKNVPSTVIRDNATVIITESITEANTATLSSATCSWGNCAQKLLPAQSTTDATTSPTGHDKATTLSFHVVRNTNPAASGNCETEIFVNKNVKTENEGLNTLVYSSIRPTSTTNKEETTTECGKESRKRNIVCDDTAVSVEKKQKLVQRNSCFEGKYHDMGKQCSVCFYSSLMVKTEKTENKPNTCSQCQKRTRRLCLTCGIPFPNLLVLHAHLLNHNQPTAKVGQFCCSLCKMQFDSEFHFYKHIAFSNCSTVCIVCESIFKSHKLKADHNCKRIRSKKMLKIPPASSAMLVPCQGCNKVKTCANVKRPTTCFFCEECLKSADKNKCKAVNNSLFSSRVCDNNVDVRPAHDSFEKDPTNCAQETKGICAEEIQDVLCQKRNNETLIETRQAPTERTTSEVVNSRLVNSTPSNTKSSKSEVFPLKKTPSKKETTPLNEPKLAEIECSSLSKTASAVRNASSLDKTHSDVTSCNESALKKTEQEKYKVTLQNETVSAAKKTYPLDKAKLAMTLAATLLTLRKIKSGDTKVMLQNNETKYVNTKLGPFDETNSNFPKVKENKMAETTEMPQNDSKFAKRKSIMTPQLNTLFKETKTTESKTTPPVKTSFKETKTTESKTTPPVKTSFKETKTTESKTTPPVKTSFKETKTTECKTTPPVKTSFKETKTTESKTTPPVKTSLKENKTTESKTTPPVKTSFKETKTTESKTTSPVKTSFKETKTTESKTTPPVKTSLKENKTTESKTPPPVKTSFKESKTTPPLKTSFKESKTTPPVKTSFKETKTTESKTTPPVKTSFKETKTTESKTTSPVKTSFKEYKTTESKTTPPVKTSLKENKTTESKTTPPVNTSLKEKKTTESKTTPPVKTSFKENKTTESKTTPPVKTSFEETKTTESVMNPHVKTSLEETKTAETKMTPHVKTEAAGTKETSKSDATKADQTKIVQKRSALVDDNKSANTKVASMYTTKSVEARVIPSKETKLSESTIMPQVKAKSFQTQTSLLNETGLSGRDNASSGQTKSVKMEVTSLNETQLLSTTENTKTDSTIMTTLNPIHSKMSKVSHSMVDNLADAFQDVCCDAPTSSLSLSNVANDARVSVCCNTKTNHLQDQIERKSTQEKGASVIGNENLKKTQEQRDSKSLKLQQSPTVPLHSTANHHFVVSCRICTYSTETHYSLDSHLYKVHQMKRRYYCRNTGCNRSFVLEKCLDLHRTAEHNCPKKLFKPVTCTQKPASSRDGTLANNKTNPGTHWQASNNSSNNLGSSFPNPRKRHNEDNVYEAECTTPCKNSKLCCKRPTVVNIYQFMPVPVVPTPNFLVNNLLAQRSNLMHSNWESSNLFPF